MLPSLHEDGHEPSPQRGRGPGYGAGIVFETLGNGYGRNQTPTLFLIRSVRNACINRINSVQIREKIRRQLPLAPESEETDIEGRDEEVREAVARLLTGRERQVVDKIYSEGLSYKDAAESLDVSVATINKNIVAALKKLRTHFKRKS